MASGEFLKEYLVSLGFQVDENSLKKWGQALGGTTGSVLKFAGVVTAASAAALAFTNSVTKQMEDLYWATQRIGSSASNIQSFELAMKKMGGTAEEARATLEGLAQNLRTNPAMEGFVKSLGVQTRDASGNMRDMVFILKDLGVQFQKMPYWVAAKWASKLGIDEGTLWKMTHGLLQFGDAYGDLYKKMGVDPKQATLAAKNFQNTLRDLGAIFDVLEAKLMMALEPKLRELNIWLIDLLTNTSKYTDRTTTLGKALENIGTAAGNLSQVLKLVGAIAQAAIWLLSVMPPEAIQMGIIGYFLFGKKATLVIGALALVSTVLDKLTGGKFTQPGKINESKIKEFGEGSGTQGEIARWMVDNGLGQFTSKEFQATYEEYKRRKNEHGTKTGGTSGYNKNWMNMPTELDALGVRNNNPTNLRSWGNNPIVNGFAKFQNAQAGISAAAGNLMLYGRRGWDTVNDIISHWAPAGHDGNNTAAYIRDVSNRLGIDAGQHLDLNNSGTLQKLIKAIISHENGYNPYSDMQISAGVNARMALAYGGTAPARSGSKNVTINQKNEFNISGSSSSDAGSVTKKISDEFGRINGDLVRDTKGAIF